MVAFVSGFTGTLGTELTKLLLDDDVRVIGYSRDETKQHAFINHPKLTKYLGDVRNEKRVLEATRGVDVIFHLCALKQVDKLEENPEEAIATNILGTENILYAQRINGIKRVLLSSTDKAVYPINTYGCSKALAERLVLRNPNNIVTRYGNVVASRGSVIPLFIKSLKESGTANITDRRMTRFWILPSQAAEFVARSSIRATGGLFIPEMKAYPIAKLINIIALLVGCSKPKIIETGIRPGEKLHEHLRTEQEGGIIVSSDERLWFKEHEIAEIVKKCL